MDCYQYFHLDGPPFQPASPRGAVYFSPNHLQALSTLETGLAGELIGLTLLTGEAGTGKTTLIYSLLQRDYKRVRIAHIDDPKLSFAEIMQVVIKQLNLYCAGTTKLDYLNTLDHLLELHGETERIAIVIDEAQLLSDDVLEELRLLSNHGLRNDGFLRVMLVGQPELAERLKSPELRALNQRISARGELKPLNQEQGRLYVECRLGAMNGKSSGVFEPGALVHLLKRSDGIPRKINVLCHTAMMAAFTAGERRVSARTARKVAAEYRDAVSLETPGARRPRFAMPALAAATVFGALMVFGVLYPNFHEGWAVNHTAALDGPIVPQIPSLKIARTGFDTPSANRAGGSASAASAASAANLPAGASAMNPPAAPATAAVGRSHIIVQYGDTLEKIAIRYFGSSSGISKLVAANPQLGNINELNVGQTLYLPIAAKAAR